MSRSWKPAQSICAIAATIVLSAITARIVEAQGASGQSRISPTELVKKINADTDTALRDAESQWRSRFASFREASRLQALTGSLVSYGQKFELAGEFLGLGSSTTQRVRAEIRTKVVDERELIRQMEAFADEMLNGLCVQDQLVIKAKGMPVYSNRGLCSPTFDPSSWSGAFDPLVRVAVNIGNADLARTATVFTGSNIASDAINDSARHAGVNPYKDGTFGDFLADLAVNVVVGFVADAATDNSASNQKKLHAAFETLEQALLHSPQGLLTSLRSAAEQHKQARLRFVATTTNGGLR